ncbi:MAG: hypothetical protein KGL53_01920 [Elusimicrobia bacterium]|nr:hypothetical protein [Elusimicrobiota bacterium]
MAPNPSAALSVLLTALLAVGPVPAAVAAGTPQTPPKTTTAPGPASGWDFIVLQVEDSVSHTYHSLFVRMNDVKDMKPGDEKPVQALRPKSMSSTSRFRHDQYKVDGDYVPIKMKLTANVSVWGAFPHSGGVWVVSMDGKAVKGVGGGSQVRGCIPNGNWRCVDGIRGVARSFVMPAPPKQAPAKTPAKGQLGQTVPAKKHHRSAPPAKTKTNPPAPGKLSDWVFFDWRGNDKKTLAVQKSAFDKAAAAAAQCGKEGAFVSLPAYSAALWDDVPPAVLKATATAEGKLKVYKPGAAGATFALCPNGADCAAPGTDQSASRCEATACKGLERNMPKAGKAGVPLAKEDLSRPFLMLLDGKTAVSGTASDVAPTPCSDNGSALEADIRSFLQDAPADMALALAAAAVAGDKSQELQALLDAAKADPKDPKKRQAFLAKAQEIVLGNVNGAVDFLKRDDGLKTAFSGKYCAPPPGAGGPAKLDKSANAKVEAAKDVGDGARMDGKVKGTGGAVSATAPLPPGSPFEALCKILNAPPETQHPTGPITNVPPPGNGQQQTCGNMPAGQACKDDANAKAAADKKAAEAKTEFKRAMVGGAGGALVLGVFGFIFGGPAGALIMGSIGFAAMAGIAYMNNNPFK